MKIKDKGVSKGKSLAHHYSFETEAQKSIRTKESPTVSGQRKPEYVRTLDRPELCPYTIPVIYRKPLNVPWPKMIPHSD